MLRMARVLTAFTFVAVHAQAHASQPINSDCRGVLTKRDKARWLKMDEDQLRRACFSHPGVAAPDMTDLTQSGYSAGLHFHENLSLDQRKRIIDDLLWLSRRGAEIHSQLLADILGIEGPVTGPKVLAWLLDRVAVVANAPAMPKPVVIAPYKVDGRYLAFPAKAYTANGVPASLIKNHDDIGDYAGATWKIMPVGDAERGETRSFRFGRYLTLPALRGAEREHQSFQLGRGLWKVAGTDTPEHLVVRLSTYLHEAAHVGFADQMHVRCPEDHWSLRLRGKIACDEGFMTAYGLDYAFVTVLSRLTDLDEESRSWIAEYGKDLLTHVKRNRYDPPPPQPISTGEALAWLRAAAVASHRGYNVPLRHVVPCQNFAGGCGRKSLEAAIRKMRKWPKERGFAHP